MNKDTAIIILNVLKKNLSVDVEVPLNISANELVIALNSGYDLGIDTTNIKNCYLKAENPIVLLKGNRTLAEFGIRNGSIINFTEQEVRQWRTDTRLHYQTTIYIKKQN